MAWTVASSTEINLPNGAKVYEGYFDGICNNFDWLVNSSTDGYVRRVKLTAGTSDVTTLETTSSTTYTDLATAGPQVVLSPGEAKDQLIIVSARMYNSVPDASYASPAIAGAAADDANGAAVGTAQGVVSSRVTLASAVANGSTHTVKYRVNSGTGSFAGRRIIAVAIA